MADQIVRRSVTIGLSEEDWEVLEALMFLEGIGGGRRRSQLATRELSALARRSAKIPEVARMVALKRRVAGSSQGPVRHLRVVR